MTEIRQTLPSWLKPIKNDFNINNSNWQMAHSTKINNERQRESME